MSSQNLLADKLTGPTFELFHHTQWNGPLRCPLDSRIDIFEGKTLGDEFLLYGTVVGRTQNTHVKGYRVHGDFF